MTDRCIHNRCRRRAKLHCYLSNKRFRYLCDDHWNEWCMAEQRRQHERWYDAQVRQVIVEGVARDVQRG